MAFFQPLILLSLTGIAVYGSNTRDICQRDAPKTTASRTPGDNGFRIKLAGNPEKYTPGQVYTVTVNGTYSNQKLQGFMLVAVPRFARDESETSGTFQHLNHGLTKFAEKCPYMVVHTYHNRKAGVEVLWTAPPSGAGCVEFRASVIEYTDIWYKDDGALTKIFCEDSGRTEDNKSPDMIPDCCACGTAKYRMEFEGIWSRQTHPKDFPTHKHLLHWSNLIGASHSKKYIVWQYGGYASWGVREVCEFGYTRTLEQEMKQHSSEIRTVIKTSGIWVNLKQSRTAHFSVNKRLHLLSMLTMLGPSPDWCVGVSALDMCLPNCTWAGDKTIELYPWDGGSDDGVSYMSPNRKSDPQQKIHRISNTFPNDPNSPFFGPKTVKPLAVLKLIRMHPKPGANVECTGNEGNNTEDFISVGDIDGHFSGQTPSDDQGVTTGKCATKRWGDWSRCSVTCGVGIRTRERVFKDTEATPKICPQVKLIERENCLGLENLCNSTTGLCDVTNWSEWSPCSVTCGNGTHERRRVYLHKKDMLQCKLPLVETGTCTGAFKECSLVSKNYTAICSEPKNIGRCRGSFQRFYYNTQQRKCLPFSYTGCRGNNNAFFTLKQCQETCSKHMERIYLKQKLPKKVSIDIIRPKGQIHTVVLGSGPNGNRFSIECKGNDPNADLTWEYNNNQLPERGDKYRVSKERKGSVLLTKLLVLQAGPTDMGFYACLDMNNPTRRDQIKIMIDSQNADTPANRVEIYEPKPPMHTVHVKKRGQKTHLILHCRTKDFSAELEWQFKDKPIEYTPKKYAIGEENDGEYMKKTVAVMNVAVSDMGVYKCVNTKAPNIPTSQDQINIAVVGHAMPAPGPDTGKVDCVVSKWSKWSKCSSTCGRGFMYKKRTIVKEPSQKGKKCPRKLVRKKKCRVKKCQGSDGNKSQGAVDCQLSGWTSWSPCTSTCGDSIQERSRRLIKKDRRGGKQCGPRVERRFCRQPPCPGSNRRDSRSRRYSWGS